MSGNTSELIVFVAGCPNGHLTIQSREKSELNGQLWDKTLVLHCERCSRQWLPDSQLEENLKQRLLNEEKYRAAKAR